MQRNQEKPGEIQTKFSRVRFNSSALSSTHRASYTTTDLEDARASHAAVRTMIANDPLVLSKLVFLREFTRKMLVHIKWFESTEARAHEVYTRLCSIQNGFSPLFDANEITSMLDIGRCPQERRDDMRSLITTASRAAGNDWTAKMERNQDDRTIELFQMIAFFDPEQKAAFIFTPDEILDDIRPIHDSIFPAVEEGYDPLAVPLLSFEFRLNPHSLCRRMKSDSILRLNQDPCHLCGTTGLRKKPSNPTSPPRCSCCLRFPMAPLMPSALCARQTRPRIINTAARRWTLRRKRR